MPPASRVPPFLLVFASLLLFALALTIVSEFSDVKWVETIISIGEGLGRLTFAVIAITFILVEGIPMLAAWYKKQMVNEAREEGRAEGIETGRAEGIETGRAQKQRAWKIWLEELEAWEERRASAESDGKTFTEPRPCPPSDD